MINEVFYRLQRPERGWDPVPTEYVKRYATEVWEGFRQESVDAIESKIGPLRGRTVIDLGGGSGRFAIEFARRGAAVTWHDISLGYRNFVKDKLAELRKEMDQLSLEFSVGYLEDAPRLGRSFDFVFNRLCWCYSIDDFRFARVIYDLTKPGGAAWVMSNHIGQERFAPSSPSARIRTLLNERAGVKIGHPQPSLRRIRAALANQPFARLEFGLDELDNCLCLLFR